MLKIILILMLGTTAPSLLHSDCDNPFVSGLFIMKNWQNTKSVNIDGEEWKDIPSLKGRYQASTKCRIRSLVYRYDLKRKVPKIISQFLSENGYCRCVLRDTKENNYKVIYKFAHRLIAETFIANPENLYTVNHKDLDKQNNEPYNLEWLSYAGNNIHAWENGVFDNNIKLKKSDILDIYNSTLTPSELMLKYNVSYTTIYQIRSLQRYKEVTKGEKSNAHKIMSNDRVIEIYNSEGLYSDIATKFSIKREDVCRIKNGRVFSKITCHGEVTHTTIATKLSDDEILEVYNSTEFIKPLLKRYKISFKRYKKIKTGELYSEITKHKA